MNTIISLIVLVIGVIVVLYLVGLLATAVALPTIIWTLIKVLIILGALAYVVRLFGYSF
ncbi:MAG: hypothetical protein ACR2N3_17840 [Pyrinomonadaceae bacterium]